MQWPVGSAASDRIGPCACHEELVFMSTDIYDKWTYKDSDEKGISQSGGRSPALLIYTGGDRTVALGLLQASHTKALCNHQKQAVCRLLIMQNQVSLGRRRSKQKLKVVLLISNQSGQRHWPLWVDLAMACWAATICCKQQYCPLQTPARGCTGIRIRLSSG